MSLIATFLVISTMILHSCEDECKKIKNPKPTKSWMSVVLSETYTVKVLQGKIVDSNDKPISKALIEVIKISENGKGKIIYICQTQESGKFYFNKLKQGKYEIRVSLEGHDRTSVKVTVSKEATSSENIIVPMKVSN
jgi:hypothetical protein